MIDHVRVAAQDAKGADVAYRSQPVIVHYEPPLGKTFPDALKTKTLGRADTLNPSTFDQLLRISLTDPATVCVLADSPGKGYWRTDRIRTHPWSPRYLDWRTSVKTSAGVRLDVVEGKTFASSPPVVWTVVDAGLP